MIKTILVLIIIFLIIVKFNVYYRDHYDGIFEISQINIKKYMEKNPYYLYIYVTVLFFIASRISMFELSNGYYGTYIKNMLSSVNDDKHEYKPSTPFIGGLSIIAIIIFSLITAISGSGLGSEGVMIYLSICMVIYMYFKFKNILGLAKINTEVLIYTGYAIGFGVTFTSLISTIIFIFEKMFHNHSFILYSYNAIIVLLIAIFVHYFIKNRNPIINIDKLHFDYYNVSSLLYICLFSGLIGLICIAFFTSFISLFNTLNKYKYKDGTIIIMGIILSFMIHKFGVFIIGSNEDVINEGFKNASNTSIFEYGPSTSSFNLQNVIGKMINCIISIGSGLSGGIIIPSMTIGSGLGSLYSKILSYLQLGTDMPIENIMYIGMVAFLSPMLDAPITSAVVINQISKQSFNTIPISLLASFISYYTYKTLHNH